MQFIAHAENTHFSHTDMPAPDSCFCEFGVFCPTPQSCLRRHPLRIYRDPQYGVSGSGYMRISPL